MLRSARLAACAGLAVLASGVPACGPAQVEHVGLRLRLSSARGCRPSVLDGVRLAALGDFAATGERVIEADPAAPIDIERFPTNTAAISALARGGGWEGFAVALIDERARAMGRDALLLPLETPCPSPDPEARVPRGGAVAELDDGSLVIVGGLDELGRATRRVVRLGAGLEIATVEPRTPFNAVAFGSATALEGATLLLAGGAATEGADPYDTYELLALDEDTAVRRGGTLASARRDHTAVRRGGDVLLVGGRDARGALATLERIEPGAMSSSLTAARLVRARVAPVVVARADGSVVVAGGHDGTAAVASVEVVSADLARSEEAVLEPALPPARWIAVLPGPRLLWAADGATFVVLLDGRPEAVRLDLVAPTPEEAVATALSDGRVLVVGRDGPGGPVVASIVDPAASAPERRAASRAPGVLWAMLDGTLVELDDVGATFRRETHLSPLEPPPASWRLPADVGALVLDAAPRWAADVGSDPAMVARVEGARLDVPALRLSRLRLTVRVSGDADVLLLGEGGVVARIELREDAAIGGCRAPRPAEDVTMVRDGDQIEIGGVRCTVLGLPARVGVGVRAAGVGMRLRSIALERLE